LPPGKFKFQHIIGMFERDGYYNLHPVKPADAAPLLIRVLNTLATRAWL